MTTRSRAANPVHRPFGSRSASGIRAACGLAYSASRPIAASRAVCTISLFHSTSQSGSFRRAIRRLTRPVVFASSASYTAFTRMPVCRSNSLRIGSEWIWSSAV